MSGKMFTHFDWTQEPNLSELHIAYEQLSTDSDAGRQKLEELANQGSIASLIYLADAYESGRYFPVDLDQAEGFYSRAEAAGWIPAHYYLGRFFYKRSNFNSAFSAFERGARKLYTPCMYRLALMYERGLGTDVDISKTAELLNAANKRGHLFAKRELARLYILGKFGLSRVPKGIFLLIGLIGDMIQITLSRQWRKSDFDDRTLA